MCHHFWLRPLIFKVLTTRDIACDFHLWGHFSREFFRSSFWNRQNCRAPASRRPIATASFGTLSKSGTPGSGPGTKIRKFSYRKSENVDKNRNFGNVLNIIFIIPGIYDSNPGNILNFIPEFQKLLQRNCLHWFKTNLYHIVIDAKLAYMIDHIINSCLRIGDWSVSCARFRLCPIMIAITRSL